jgi:hypothetical protein
MVNRSATAQPVPPVAPINRTARRQEVGTRTGDIKPLRTSSAIED